MFTLLAQVAGEAPLTADGMSIQSLASIVVNVGLAAGLVLFFVFKGDKREQKGEDRILALEEFQKTTLMDMVKENAALLERNAELLERCAKALESNKS